MKIVWASLKFDFTWTFINIHIQIWFSKFKSVLLKVQQNCYWTTPEKARSKFSYNQVSLCKRPIGWLGWPVPWYPPQLFRLIKVSLSNFCWINYFTLMCLVSNKLLHLGSLLNTWLHEFNDFATHLSHKFLMGIT